MSPKINLGELIMLAKKFSLLIFLFLTSFVFAQNKAILTPDGKIIHANGDIREVVQGAKLIHHNKAVKNVFVSSSKTTTVKGAIDTLSVFNELNLERNINFGFFSQDVMVQWYVAPADLYLKAIAFTVSDGTGFDNGNQVKVSVVGTDLTADEIRALSAPTYIGYYPSDDYMNNRTPFPWFANGDWTPAEEGMPEVWTEDLWSDFGEGYPVTGVPSTEDEIIYNWVVLNDALGFEPDMIEKGHVFGIAIQHAGQNEVQPDEERVGFWSNEVGDIHAGFKYYSMGRLNPPNDAGWWTRQYTWDFVAQVEFIDDFVLRIINVTRLNSTFSTDPRHVEATVISSCPTDADSCIQSVTLQVSTDEMATWTDIEMTPNGGVYSAEIPGYSSGTTVYYKIVATDINGNSVENGPYYYKVLAFTQTSLLIFNGYSDGETFLTGYYFYDDPNGYATKFDLWAYGVLEDSIASSVFSHYTNIFEITSKGPLAIYNTPIRNWLNADAEHNYALFGDEWLGSQSNWTDTSHSAGEFQYDILGITYEYNDVNFATSGDQGLPYPLFAVENSLLGGDVAASVAAIGDTLKYDSYGIYAVSNWIDAVDFQSDVEIDYQTIPKGTSEFKPTMGHRTLSAGNKIVFGTFDPLYLTSDSIWYGATQISPIIKTADWFGLPVGVETETMPEKFELSQNYPNPFNPTTVIKYTLPENANVTLKVYNLVGQEVATLVNDNQVVGTYQIRFDASNLSSGVYFYTLKAGDFTASKKMVLLK